MIQNLHILSLGRNLALGMPANDSALRRVHSQETALWYRMLASLAVRYWDPTLSTTM
jgi:hypothetical protein